MPTEIVSLTVALGVVPVVMLDLLHDLAPLDHESDEHEGDDGGADEEGDADDGRTVVGRVAEAAPSLLHFYWIEQNCVDFTTC